MIRLAKKTRLSPEEAVKKAVAFFGPKGYGLTVHEESPTCVRFEGAGGTVEVTSCTEEKGSSVEVVAQEWDIQAKEFMGKIR